MWGDLAGLSARMETLELQVSQLASVTPVELLKMVEGLKCTLAVVERRVRELEARQEVLAEMMATGVIEARAGQRQKGA